MSGSGDEGAHVRSHLDGSDRVIGAEAMVMATTNLGDAALVAATSTHPCRSSAMPLLRALPRAIGDAALVAADLDASVSLVGDALVARLAAHAIDDGRVAAKRL